jgi:protein TonB
VALRLQCRALREKAAQVGKLLTTHDTFYICCSNREISMLAYVLLIAAATPDLLPVTTQPDDSLVVCEDGTRAETVSQCPGERLDLDLVEVESEEPLPVEEGTVSFVLPAPTDGSSLPIPKASPGLWLSTRDYPTEALADGRSGRTSFRLQVNTAGTVTGCEVLVSSGHKDLDDATCDLISQRALFDPATTKRGKKVAGIYQNSVLWRIPDTADLPKPGQTTIVFVVETDGRVSSCKFTANIELPEGFDGCGKPPIFEPRRDENGNPIRVRVVTSTVVKLYKLPTAGVVPAPE